ncbi:hypothetical protein [Streptomyces cellulosae]|uniref:Uncharacterized protein n=1 Tax=Streptomyces cellulosae TaxID=1968 RepID=A0ABW7XWF2_STRCE
MSSTARGEPSKPAAAIPPERAHGLGVFPDPIGHARRQARELLEGAVTDGSRTAR